MRNVYYDVENTLEVPFITGIQRVVREFSKIVLSDNKLLTDHRFIPVVYDHNRMKWRKLDNQETKSLMSSVPWSPTFLNRVKRKLQQLLPKPKSLSIDQFETDSIFLDIESSWHSKLNRSKLLPQLRQSGVKIAKLHYDIVPLLFPDTTHPNTVKVFSDHFESHLKYSDLFLCISNTTLNDVKQYCEGNSISPPSLQTIQLGTNLEFPNSANHVNLQAVNLQGHKLADFGQYLLSVGTIEPRKNYPLLLQAFNGVLDDTDLHLVIVGKTGWLADDVISEIKDHPDYGSRIHLLQQITDPELDILYKSAWLSVVPSLYEGFGLPVVESLARGCPTICSTAGSLSEAGNDSVRYFSPYSAGELAAIILELYANPAALELLSEAARHYQPASWGVTVAGIDFHFSAL